MAPGIIGSLRRGMSGLLRSYHARPHTKFPTGPRALAGLWPEVPTKRCTVHTIRTQSTNRLREALTPRRGAAQGDDMADLQAAIADDDALDHELQDRLLVGQRRLVQAAADAGAERRQVRPRRFGSQPLLA